MKERDVVSCKIKNSETYMGTKNAILQLFCAVKWHSKSLKRQNNCQLTAKSVVLGIDTEGDEFSTIFSTVTQNRM